MNKSDLVQIRGFLPDDRNLIFSTWLIGLFYGHTFYSLIPKHIFMANYHTVIENLLKSPKVEVRIACLKEDPSVILGYSILGSENAVHWVFVKKSWRGIGIAKDLVPATVVASTHFTKLGLSIMKKKNIAYNPFLV